MVRPLPLLLALTLVAALLAGCAANEAPKSTSVSSSRPPATASSTSTPPTAPPGQPPTPPTTTAPPPPPAGSGTAAVEVRRTTAPNATGMTQSFTVAASFRNANGSPATPAGADWSIAYRKVRSIDGSPASGATGNGPRGSTLPASFQLTFPGNGTFVVEATVKAAGFSDGKASLETLVLTPPLAPLLVDGAENGTSLWRFSSWFNQFGFVPLALVPPNAAMDEHPNGTWSPQPGDAHSGARAWAAPYPDQYNTTMVSVPLAIPDDGRHHRLTYWLRGGVENNTRLNVDGLHVYVQAQSTVTQVQYVTDDHDAWTQFEVSLDAWRGKTIQIGLSFQSDGFCSKDNGPEGRDAWDTTAAALIGPCDPSSYEGYRVDDIVVI